MACPLSGRRARIVSRSPEPGARSPEPGARSPEPGARSPEPGAGSREPGAGLEGCVARPLSGRRARIVSRSPEPGARSPEPGAGLGACVACPPPGRPEAPWSGWRAPGRWAVVRPGVDGRADMPEAVAAAKGRRARATAYGEGAGGAGFRPLRGCVVRRRPSRRRPGRAAG
ncbi:hypothetical protein F6Q10_26880 [Streptomyces vinaceus]|nr:hypothetical protein [Streptomyces vinaceus]